MSGGVRLPLKVGEGFTNTVDVIELPGHPLALGVIVNVTVIGVAVVLVNAPLILFPLPLAAIPVTFAVLSLVQLNVVPVAKPDKLIPAILLPEQIGWLVGVAVAVAVGFTKIVAVIAAPGQLLAVGVIVNVTVIGSAVEFIKVPPIFPLPLFAIVPVMPGLSLVQLKVVPPTPLVRSMVVLIPEQTG